MIRSNVQYEKKDGENRHAIVHEKYAEWTTATSPKTGTNVVAVVAVIIAVIIVVVVVF